MQRKLCVLTTALFASLTLFSQNFPGFRSGNYTGVNGVFYNPANIADNRYRWDANLLSFNVNAGNSQATFKLKTIETLFSGDNVDSVLFGASGKESSGMAYMEFIGPSVMFRAGMKNSFAITTRVRTIGNIRDIDGKLIQSIDDENDQTPITLNSSSKQKVIINGWSEIGGSFGRVLLNKGDHFLKAGITAKFLMGSTNSFVAIDNLKGTLDEDGLGDTYLTGATGRVAIGVSGFDFDDSDAEASEIFKSQGKGVGFDIGLVYEYRPNGSNNYKIKAGIALLDIGAITYKPKADQFGDYSVNIPAGVHWYPNDLNDKSISEIKEYFDASPYFTNNAVNLKSYKAKLPTTLQANVDLNLHKGFYAELAGQINLVGKTNIYSAFSYNAVTLTPRYEGRHFGFYLPINYNQLTNLNVGVSFRAGPFFIGSGSLLTALFDKSKQADAHMGIRFGALQKKSKK
jgi:hypothetical protein